MFNDALSTFLLTMQLQTTLFPSLALSQCASQIALSSTWDLLGPFQIGTREAEWGADPLSFHGGFQNLIPENTTFPSSLPLNGSATWFTTTLSRASPPSNSSRGTISVSFNNTNWDVLRSTYGWSGIQFQAWARGEIDLCEEETVVVYVVGANEFWIDDRQYFGGDMYAYKLAPVVVNLGRGKHKLDVRVAHDIRAFGGGMPPSVGVEVDVRVANGGLVAVEKGVVVSDLVAGRLAGRWVSVPVRNEEMEGWIEVLEVSGGDNSTTVAIGEGYLPLRIAPGQSRPVKFLVEEIGFNSSALAVNFKYKLEHGAKENWISVRKSLTVVANLNLPQKYTFLHPSGIVSYAILRPPPSTSSCAPHGNDTLPILLAFHGAGVEADSDQSKSQYDGMPDVCSWVFIPSGVTTWSGDDWHIWGFADVEAGIKAIPQWMKDTNWDGQGIDLDKWVITGHSNGGQGTWYALTHRNDKVIAAAPLSGYLSIPAYVPYHMWHESDPKKMSMVLASLNSYKHELLTQNMVGTPIIQQHGREDDNVPVFHSRRMSQLITEAGWEADYWEIPGRGHWWEGVMLDGGLSPFLRHYLEERPVISELPSNFSIVTANPADMGARGGIVIDQLYMPDQLGRIDVGVSASLWHLQASNIRRWHFEKPRSSESELPTRVIIDDQELEVPTQSEYWFVCSLDLKWSVVSSSDWKLVERVGQQWGSLDAFLSTKGHFNIFLPQGSAIRPYHAEVASDISRNLFQYFAADSEISSKQFPANTTVGNSVFIGFPEDLGVPLSEISGEFSISKSEDAVFLQDASGYRRRYRIEPGMGLIYLYPLPNESLGIVLWGADEVGLRAAARLFPLRTGVGQPNFILLGNEAGWSGVGGVRAMGMFDFSWKISSAAYL